MQTVYLKNREWTKKFKFNNHWYDLKSLFDKDRRMGNGMFDFDKQSLKDRSEEYDFDKSLDRQSNKFEDLVTQHKVSRFQFDDINSNDDHWATSKLFKSVK